MAKSRNALKTARKIFSDERQGPGRGRPPKVNPSWVRGTADSYRWVLEQKWNDLGAHLLAAQTTEEVIHALQRCHLDNYFSPALVPVIRTVLTSPNFPRRRKAQVNFLADSIAAGTVVSPRRSRDICAEQRKADAQKHKILRYEYWIECSCGYKGFSENHSCKDCGATLYVPGLASE
jgi:hypothetical protein